ncbi:HAD family hydrolase [Thermophagus sp. OGC60D27]|uniref:HAD family hydrolase n=1 Tax=Thermophagus sp. OGC60D27 TaxID=3458415 RepID=UPI0040379BFA
MNNLKPEGIKNIIFDLGNVLIPLQMEQAGKAFRKLISDHTGITDPLKLSQLDSFTQYETGKISTRRFFESLKPYFKSEVTIEDFSKAWNQILGEFPMVHAQMLTQLQARYQLFLLSNTNELHADYFEQNISGIIEPDQVFKRIYYSHVEGLRKPQQELYLRVLSQNHLQPSETLFADDLPENIESAKQLGIRTLQVTPDMDLPKLFAAF